ncbi:MAG: AAA family ATPase [Nanoarchaeota archaeon]|nr:AAA family ATPase [Nanoarchaeota archaeon]MBU1644246.1 AAA family ATPase [Nanoarchaeota archaeon]MBU1977234.1 AAA family ATPase [Nanoarchaeota archaeon]
MLKTIIAISGTPGVGKSTLAKSLSQKLGLERLDLHEHYKEISGGYDRSKQCYNINLKKFTSFVKKKIKKSEKGFIIDTHISHLLSKKIVDLCIVLTCSDLKELEKRLKKRKYSSKKIRENLDAEIFQICLIEAKEKKHNLLSIDTAKKITFEKIFNQVKKRLKGI